MISIADYCTKEGRVLLSRDVLKSGSFIQQESTPSSAMEKTVQAVQVGFIQETHQAGDAYNILAGVVPRVTSKREVIPRDGRVLSANSE